MISKYISIVFHPSIVTFLGFLVIILRIGFSTKEIIVTSVFFSLLPFGVTLLLKKKGKISDLFVTSREERYLPILLSLLGYIIGLVLLLPINIVFFVAISYFLNTIVLLVITLKYKISIHVATTAGMIVAILMIFRSTSLIPLLFLLFIVGWARIKERAHTLGQVILGGLVSSLLAFLELLFLTSFA